jgi:hypothetical protein
MNMSTYTQDQVVEMINEALEEQHIALLHPEFGIEWQEPDGLLYKAWHAGFQSGLATAIAAAKKSNS